MMTMIRTRPPESDGREIEAKRRTARILHGRSAEPAAKGHEGQGWMVGGPQGTGDAHRTVRDAADLARRASRWHSLPPASRFRSRGPCKRARAKKSVLACARMSDLESTRRGDIAIIVLRGSLDITNLDDLKSEVIAIEASPIR